MFSRKSYVSMELLVTTHETDVKKKMDKNHECSFGIERAAVSLWWFIHGATRGKM